mgnify:CR=1 FL=1
MPHSLLIRLKPISGKAQQPSLPITQPSLGLLIANGYQVVMSGQYWMSVYPGLLLLASAINEFLGNGFDRYELMAGHVDYKREAIVQFPPPLRPNGRPDLEKQRINVDAVRNAVTSITAAGWAPVMAT